MKIIRNLENKTSYLFIFVVFALYLGVICQPLSASAQDIPEDIQISESTLEVVNDYLSIEHRTYEDGTQLSGYIISGPSAPPKGFSMEGIASSQVRESRSIIADFPSYSWVFGCSAVSGAMIAGYYDRNGFPNMYTGPTNGGVMPLSDTSWSTWTDDSEGTYPNNPLIASHIGVDGRGTRGSIDDYWVEYLSPAVDPYISGGWTEHTWGSAIGDYMKTSQSSYNNKDGSTSFYNYQLGTEWEADKLTCSQMESYGIHDKDGTYGRKLFYEDRGYSITECYSQNTDNIAEGGFSLADYQAQIDAGHPVLLNLEGHSIVGYGYSDSDNTIYIRNTWDNDPNTTYTMTWGGSYEEMDLLSVSIVELLTVPPTPIAPTGAIYEASPTYEWAKVIGATQYQLELYNAGMTTLIYSKDVTEPNCAVGVCSVTFVNELAAGSYEWKIRAYINGEYDPWSSIAKFSYFDPALNKYFPLIMN